MSQRRERDGSSLNVIKTPRMPWMPWHALIASPGPELPSGAQLDRLAAAIDPDLLCRFSKHHESPAPVEPRGAAS